MNDTFTLIWADKIKPGMRVQRNPDYENTPIFTVSDVRVVDTLVVMIGVDDDGEQCVSHVTTLSVFRLYGDTAKNAVAS